MANESAAVSLEAKQPNAPKGKKNRKGSGMSSMKAKENFWGYLFILPNLVGFCVFTLFGIVFSLVMSFTDWNLIKGFEHANFVGLENFAKMFTDSYFLDSIRNNGILLLVVPVSLVISVTLASIMNKSIYWRAGARALYFLPYVTNIVAIATVWQALFHPSKGPINAMLGAFGVATENLPMWLSDLHWALPAVMIIMLWKDLGYNILMFSAGLQNIPQDYYEAAEVDGANAFQKFSKITIPMLSPTTFMLSILGIISSLQMWGLAQVITAGGPGTATYTLSLYIYRSAFVSFRTGYASALSWVLCIFILIITLIQWIGQKKWVNY